ncbi:hypothetical protein AAMO2058_001131000 [Amorphochlora amoebiformis]
MKITLRLMSVIAFGGLMFAVEGARETLEEFPFVDIEGVEISVDLCESARAHAEKLEPRILQNYDEFRGILFEEGSDGFLLTDLIYQLKKIYGYDASKVRHTPQNLGRTRIVQMNTTRKMREAIIKEMSWTRKLQDTINDYLRSLGQTEFANYNSYSLEFDNAILFSPTGYEFYLSNRHIIEELFPDLGGISLNAFSVRAGKSAYGAHNARPWSVGLSKPVCKLPLPNGARCLFPDKQMSLHTALEEVTYDHQPLVMYEDAEPEIPSSLYMAQKLNGQFPPHSNINKSLEMSRYFLANPSLGDENIFLSATQYQFARYIEQKYCNLPWKIPGVYWNLEPGQAVFFNNYVPHGDCTLPKSSRDRFTIDLRMFSKDYYPSDLSSVAPRMWRARFLHVMHTKKCLSIILGYQDEQELLEVITGGRLIVNSNGVQLSLVHIMTDIGLALHGSYGAERQDILTFQEGLKRHFERVRVLMESDPVLPDKAKTCIAETLGSDICDLETGTCDFSTN